jgi:hypothetical protein
MRQSHGERAVTVRSIKKATIPEELRVRPLQRAEFRWPDIAEIRSEQQKWLKEEQCIDKNTDGLVVTKSGKVVIPSRSEDLKMRLCAIAHSGGNIGHLGNQAAVNK